jgi:hypothetical protein
VKAFAALVATGLALAAAGCSGGDGEQAPQGRPAPQLVAATDVEGGAREERALLRAVSGGMEQSTLERISIGGPGTRRETDDGEEVIALTFTPVAGVTTRRQWDEWIVAGAFSRRLLEAGLPAEVDGGDDRGVFTARPKLKGQPDPKPLSVKRRAAIVKAVRAAAQSSGARIVRLEVHRPYGVALALSLASDDPAAFLKNRLRPLLRRLDVYRPRLEGLYLAVLDEEGRLALEWGSWTRNRAGSYWVRHDLTNCSPIRQTEPPGSEPPPPCSA